MLRHCTSATCASTGNGAAGGAGVGGVKEAAPRPHNADNADNADNPQSQLPRACAGQPPAVAEAAGLLELMEAEICDDAPPAPAGRAGKPLGIFMTSFRKNHSVELKNHLNDHCRSHFEDYDLHGFH